MRETFSDLHIIISVTDFLYDDSITYCPNIFRWPIHQLAISLIGPLLLLLPPPPPLNNLLSSIYYCSYFFLCLILKFCFLFSLFIYLFFSYYRLASFFILHFLYLYHYYIILFNHRSFFLLYHYLATHNYCNLYYLLLLRNYY